MSNLADLLRDVALEATSPTRTVLAFARQVAARRSTGPAPRAVLLRLRSTMPADRAAEAAAALGRAALVQGWLVERIERAAVPAPVDGRIAEVQVVDVRLRHPAVGLAGAEAVAAALRELAEGAGWSVDQAAVYDAGAGRPVAAAGTLSR